MTQVTQENLPRCSNCGSPIKTLKGGVAGGNIFCRDCYGKETYTQPSQSHPQDGQPTFSIEDGRYSN
jgi:hypothetical protein